jgi:CelD/BcsL family acetyltransferase involved in cellulose biosynthesis
MSPHGHLVSVMRQRARQDPAGVTIEAGETLPYLPLPARFDDLLAQHSANFRSEVRRRRRNLERHGGPVRLQVATSAEEISTAISLLFTLHNQRRQQKNDVGIFEEESLRQFHRQVALRLAGKRLARIYVLSVNGEAIAALYGFETRQRFYYFQSGWNPQWSRLSPGTVMLSMVVEDCIARGLHQFEFLRGTEEYKARWTDKVRPTLDVLAARGMAARTYLLARNLWKYRLQAVGPRIPSTPEQERPVELTLRVSGMIRPWPDSFRDGAATLRGTIG